MSDQPGHPRLVLGVTGGISAYKAIEVCRRLVDAGVHVVPVLTADAHRFVTPLTFSALASEPVQTSLFDAASPIPHTELGQSADLVLVAPATANFLARYAAGLADDLLSATLLATRAPVVVCPAMHTEMWEHASVRDNLATLARRGVVIVPPDDGPLAGGDSGTGRLADPATIVAAALAVLGGRRDLVGRRVLVSAGGTREPLDPVRFISNRSSGKQGHALAAAAAARGADVVLVTASPLPDPVSVRVVRVETAAEMERAMHDEAAAADIVVMAAAVADFRPKEAAAQKLTKDDGLPDLVLEPTPDIVSELTARRRPGQVIVGFAAETHDALARGRKKLERKGLDLMVVNDVTMPGAGFNLDTNIVTIVSPEAATSLPIAAKSVVADAVLDRALALLDQPERTQ
jgi:phosphopantothenoylcysteine decarboxylase / phosphopantothenate---cysteine ligase